MKEQNNEEGEREGKREREGRKDVSGNLTMAGEAAVWSSDSVLTT